jgi:hypothetical protein
MIISGHAYLLRKEIHRLPHLPNHECELLMAELTHITQAVETMAAHLDAYREDLIDSAEDPGVQQRGQ